MTFRPVGVDELNGWRNRLPKGWQRAISKPVRLVRHNAPAEQVGEDTATFELADPVPQSPRDTFDRTVDLLMTSAKRSRLDFQQALAQFRKWSPGLLANMSDEQAAALLEAETRRKVEEAVRRVYRQKHREHELAITIPGDTP